MLRPAGNVVWKQCQKHVTEFVGLLGVVAVGLASFESVEFLVVVVFNFARHGREQRVALAGDVHAAAFLLLRSVFIGGSGLYGGLTGVAAVENVKYAAHNHKRYEDVKCNFHDNGVLEVVVTVRIIVGGSVEIALGFKLGTGFLGCQRGIEGDEAAAPQMVPEFRI